MKMIPKIIFWALSAVFFVYLALPDPDFPSPPPDSMQSVEPADQETPLRRAYFTDLARQEVIDHSREDFDRSVFGLTLPSIRLNYPPEEAQEKIRDQTRSTFLEEIVHPFRESIYINGFEPKDAKDDIWYKGTHFRTRLIIKHNPSSVFVRVGVAILIIWGASLLVKEWLYGEA